MKKPIKLHIQKLPEGVYLATSDQMPGLVAQGRTKQETKQIAQSIAMELAVAKEEKSKKS